MVYGPDRPYFKQKQKNYILRNLGQLAFLIYYFLLFEAKKMEHNKHINNPNQEAFIVIITNYTFSSVFAMQNNIF